jgi:hypothetical protein
MGDLAGLQEVFIMIRFFCSFFGLLFLLVYFFVNHFFFFIFFYIVRFAFVLTFFLWFFLGFIFLDFLTLVFLCLKGDFRRLYLNFFSNDSCLCNLFSRWFFILCLKNFFIFVAFLIVYFMVRAI